MSCSSLVGAIQNSRHYAAIAVSYGQRVPCKRQAEAHKNLTTMRKSKLQRVNTLFERARCRWPVLVGGTIVVYTVRASGMRVMRARAMRTRRKRASGAVICSRDSRACATLSCAMRAHEMRAHTYTCDSYVFNHDVKTASRAEKSQ
eukprot:1665469-Pleurochrysis_carterae.AAC.1